MRKPYPELPRYTWDLAEILGLWPAVAFGRAHGIRPATIRKWAHDGAITRCGIGPKGVVLYHYSEVVKCAETRQPRRVA